MSTSPLSPAVPLRETHLLAIKEALEAHPRRMVTVPGRRQAGVLIMLFERDEGPWVVLTERTHSVSLHKGEISFPGGARDPEDEDLWATAVRETVEELGVDPNTLQQLGALDDYPTFSSGYIVSAFVAAVEPPEGWLPSEHEIAQVLEFPLRELLDVGRMEVWEREGIRFPMHIFDVGGHRIWGVTAFILRRFLDIVGPALEETAAP
jgi:8-oxo-dGTP pyrophosphatase MutT (NUDIX family)